METLFLSGGNTVPFQSNLKRAMILSGESIIDLTKSGVSHRHATGRLTCYADGSLCYADVPMNARLPFHHELKVL